MADGLALVVDGMVDGPSAINHSISHPAISPQAS
jgi:hypothetical protein